MEGGAVITKTTITVDSVNRLPHGTVRRAPEGFAHAILLDQNGQDAKWLVVDLYGPIETDHDVEVADWPVVYVPASDEVWAQVLFSHLRDPEEVNSMRNNTQSGQETEQEQQGRGDTHNGPTFPKR